MMAVAILWRVMERIVDDARGSWYEGGYRANIVTYTIAKLAHDARAHGNEIDLEAIWNKQEVGYEPTKYLGYLAQEVQKVLLNTPPGVKNVGEWCKKEQCWNQLSALKVVPVFPISGVTISRDERRSQKVEGKKQGTVDDGISVQQKVLDLTTSGYWNALLAWPRCTTLFPVPDRSLIQKASTQQGFVRIGLEKDWKKLLQLKEAAEDEGFRHSKK